ncbi:glycoside hydrolase family 92 protein [Olivibacter sp. SDN3]|uniref:GH92 family glycosyl hydrolase n=1 Tax=Olivibacter sp. SDN3 TaxID=2764720 RepID=UPI0016514EE2|nr:GH92 family glycosyl hydrolase [Olivibacter sp. SDN3]QNL48374.1 glycoside hydrolase family 92 protein [Olivibacter sp. SDN3]
MKKYNMNLSLSIGRFLLLVLFFSKSFTLSGKESAVIWQIGKQDGSPSGMALAPNDFQAFVERDFGFEDRFFLIGSSDPAKDWPYVLPGPANSWGGTGRTAGIRSQFLNIYFELADVPPADTWTFVMDVLAVDPKKAPKVKILINKKPYVFELKRGSGGEDPVGPFKEEDRQQLSIDIPKELIKTGCNEVTITSLTGGWLVFDYLALHGPARAKVKEPTDALVKSIETANYETLVDGKYYQPLLVDVCHLTGDPLLEVRLDGETILKQELDSGRYQLEAPMPAVSQTTKSKYSVYIDDTLYSEGEVDRSHKDLVTPADYVNTMMGAAHSRWMIAPGPWMPFGMVKLSPDNQNSGWQAGYDPTFESVGTFSHIHEWTMTGLGTFPVTGPLKTTVGDQEDTGGGYRSQIDKASEEAPLGYYKVDLVDYDITAELTAGTRSSFQRYTYHKSDSGRVMVDLKIPTEYDYQIQGVSLKKVNDHRIVGYSQQISRNVWSGGVDQEYIVHFVMEFDQPILNFGTWRNGEVKVAADLVADSVENAGMFVEFDTRDNKVVQVRTGLSYVSVENAALNLKEEISDPYGWSFDAVYQGQKDTWNELLDRIAIRSNDYLQKERFYTNMYRSLASRNTFSDVDGRWRSADEKVREFVDKDDRALGCDAFWNTFWNLNQFWNLVTPEWSSKWVKSQLAMYDANGWLAKGPAGMEYIPVMVAEHEIPLIVGAYQMGIRDYDVEKAFEAVYKMQTTLPSPVEGGFAGNRDLATYLKHAYVPHDEGRFSNSLEYSFDDWTVSQFAKALDKQEAYEMFKERGGWWKNAIDAETGYARMRDAKGEWLPDFDPFKSGANEHYVEGNAWQLTFFVPQNVPALAEYIGKNRFLKRLEWGFGESYKWRFNGPNDQYWDYPVVQGNQQSMHFAFLFNWVKKPWLTQQWSRAIGERYYGHGIANAYLGDEDQGQMSAWFVMNALGLFQTDGGTRVNPIYEIGSPLFEQVTIDLGRRYGRGETFIIEARHASKKNKYVQHAVLNGKKLDNFWFDASELLNGGSLILEMGEKPNKEWGTASLPPALK